MEYRLRNREKLLGDIEFALRDQRFQRARIGDIEVMFVVSGTNKRNRREFKFGLVNALAAISNDTYWDERGDWSEADAAIVRIM